MTSSASSTQAWQSLLDGNARFVAGTPTSGTPVLARPPASTETPRPVAVVFDCPQAPVPAHVAFDLGLDDLYVVSTVRHALDAGVMGSMEYGVGLLGAPLVVVLGHDDEDDPLRVTAEKIVADSALIAQRVHEGQCVVAAVTVDYRTGGGRARLGFTMGQFADGAAPAAGSPPQ